MLPRREEGLALMAGAAAVPRMSGRTTDGSHLGRRTLPEGRGADAALAAALCRIPVRRRLVRVQGVRRRPVDVGAGGAVKQGIRANASGHAIEEVLATFVEPRCKERGYEFKRQHELCTGIFGTQIRTDIFIGGVPEFPAGLSIESKWQDSHGTADEKLAYLYLNIVNCFPCPCIIVADGGGARAGAIDWLRGKIDGAHLLAV